MVKIEWNKVTWYSKILAVVLALAIFGLGYYLGTQVQHTVDLNQGIQVYP